MLQVIRCTLTGIFAVLCPWNVGRRWIFRLSIHFSISDDRFCEGDLDLGLCDGGDDDDDGNDVDESWRMRRVPTAPKRTTQKAGAIDCGCFGLGDAFSANACTNPPKRRRRCRFRRPSDNSWASHSFPESTSGLSVSASDNLSRCSRTNKEARPGNDVVVESGHNSL